MDAIKRLFSILSVLSLAGIIAFYKVLDDSPLEQNKRTLVIATSQRNDEIDELKDNVNKLLRAVVAMADTENNTNLSSAADQILKEIKGDFSSKKLSSDGVKGVMRKYEPEDLTISRNEDRLEEEAIKPEVDMKPDATHSKDISANREPEEKTKVNQNEAGKAKDTIQAENIDKVDTTTDEIKQDTRSGPGSMEDEVEDDDEDESRAEDEDTTIEGFARDFNSSAALIEVSLNATSGNYSFSLDVAQNTTNQDEPAKKINKGWIAPAHFYNKRFHKEKINEFVHEVLVENTKLCSNDTEILTLVNTRIEAIYKRDSIRRTWGFAMHKQRWFKDPLPTKFALGFVIGLSRNPLAFNKTLLEHQKHKDMIIGDFYDAYNNLTRKSLLGMKWAFTHCPQARYFIKSDDDMFLNLPGILTALERTPLHRSMMGPIIKPRRVARYGKWRVPWSIHPVTTYPYYLSGSAYIVDMGIVKELFEAAEYFPHNTVDDAFITGVLAKYIGKVKLKDPGGFSLGHTRFPTACDIVTNRRLTGHKYSAPKLLRFWNQLRTFNSTAC